MVRGAPSHRTRPPHDLTKASLKSVVIIIMEKARKGKEKPQKTAPPGRKNNDAAGRGKRVIKNKQ